MTLISIEFHRILLHPSPTINFLDSCHFCTETSFAAKQFFGTNIHKRALARAERRKREVQCVKTYWLNAQVIGLKSVGSNSDIWPLERPEGMPAIQSLEVMCGKDHMDVHLSFSQPFEGIVSSKGQHADPRCVYVPPSTGQTFFSFRIAYAR